MNYEKQCRFVLLVLALGLLGVGGVWAQPCVAPDNGSGTPDLFADCPFFGLEPMLIINGPDVLGSAIECAVTIDVWVNPDEIGGGDLGGDMHAAEATLFLEMVAVGGLLEAIGWNSFVQIPVLLEAHTGPRMPGDPVQVFPNLMNQLQGSVFGHPEFAELHITGGDGFGLPSPGGTTLTDLGDGTFNVDSFFDITYQIDFIGAPGSLLDGLFGTTVGTAGIQQGAYVEPPGLCRAPDNGTGTADLLADCPFTSPDEVLRIIDGLEAGDTIESVVNLHTLTGRSEAPGGGLDGHEQTANATLALAMSGTGSLGWYTKNINVPVALGSHTGPRTPGDPVQAFAAEMLQLQGEIVGDPDFDLLRVTAGSGFGLPSPGHTTLAKLPSGNFAVDSFFDITYRIEFTGAPGGAFDGRSGTTEGTMRIEQGDGDIAGLPCTLCGPGAHWLETCPAGTSTMLFHRATLGVDLDLDCVVDIPMTLDPCLPIEHMLVVRMTAPQDDSVHYPGLALVDGHMDVIDTEIIEMCLTGDGATLRAGAGNGGLTAPSLGAMVEQPGDPFMIDSFFDVFVEVEIPGLGTYYNHEPVRVESPLTCLPPDNAVFTFAPGCIELYDDPVAGTLLGHLITAEHWVNPVEGEGEGEGEGESEGEGEGEGESEGEGEPQAQLTCTPDSIYEQPPDDLVSMLYYLSDETLAVLFPLPWDEFSSVSEPICDVHWWGFEADVGSGPCVRSADTFTVEIKADDGGVPGATVWTYLVTATKVDTGLLYTGTHPLYYYSADLLPCSTLDAGWISIRGRESTVCFFAWATSAIGNDAHMYWDNGGGAYVQESDDLAFCLTTTLIDCEPCTPSETTTFSVGDNACLYVPDPVAVASGFSWSRVGGTLPNPGASSIYCRSLVLSDLQLGDAGEYRCVYDDGTKAAAEYFVTIAVAESVPVAHALGIALLVMAGALGGAAAARRRRPQ